MFRITVLVILLGLLSPTMTFASNIVEVLPLTDQILLVHFDDGYVRHHERGEERSNEWVVGAPLNVMVASSPATYYLTSTTDAFYTPPQAPVSVGRKSKGTDFTWLCEGWSFQNFFGVDGCNNTSQDHAKEHWIYLRLPSAMETGGSYTLNTGNLSEGSNTFTFTFNENELRSEAIHVNNLGYTPDAPAKYAYVYHWMGDLGGLDLSDYEGNDFHLLDTETGNIVYTGQLAFRKAASTVETLQNNPNETPAQNFLGAAVYECNFSDFNTEGSYRLVVSGIGASFPFEIACDAYRPAYRSTMRGLFMNRSGIELTAEHTDWPRPAPHHPQLTPGFAGQLIYTTTTQCDVIDPEGIPEDRPTWEAGFQGALEETWGWYQDAGDWDAYPEHTHVPAQLLFTYEHFADNFADGDLNIVESGNDLPDLLDEARWLIRFYKRVRDEITAKGWGTGGVAGARVMGDLWGEDTPNDIGRGSWEDTDRTWIVSGEDPYISYIYAGMAAHLGYLLERDGLTDPEGINWLSEAASAYSWAQNNESSYLNCDYFDLRAARLYAATALFRNTAETAYENQLSTDFNGIGVDDNYLLEDEIGYAVYLYLGTPAAQTNGALRTQLASALRYTGDYLLLDFTDNRACRWGGNSYFPMLVGQGTTPLVFPGIMAYALFRDVNTDLAADYWEVLHTTADYFLGTNPLNMTWITGVGDRSPEDAFHLDSWYSGQTDTREGIVPYGPWLQTNTYANIGPWDNHWANKTVYPAINNWPGHERWFNQRTAPLAAEFTVHQNTINAAVLYGALAGDSGCSTSTNSEDIANLAATFKLDVAPNPATVQFRIKWEADVERLPIQLYNFSGQLILESEVQNGAWLNVQHLPVGVYLLSVARGNDATYTTKVVIN